jgi:sugar lactone lactonase YvrE
MIPVTLLAALVAGCSAAPEPTAPPGSAAAQPGSVVQAPPTAPDVIKLPKGFAPEGIAAGPGAVAYLGDRENGAIFRVDLATGRGSQLAAPTGRGVQGIKERAGRLYAAGRTEGDARVFDAATGRELASLPLVAQPTPDNNLVNDVLLTSDAWWLTESRNAVLYRVALPATDALPTARDVRAVPLTGEFRQQRGINANGITATPDGSALLIVQSNTGTLFRVDPSSGHATAVDLAGARLDDGDGMLLVGQTLYVAQNGSNTLTVVALDPAGSRGKVTRRITDSRFDAPTTIATWADRLYLPNARFDQEPAPTTEYTIASVPIPG